MFQELNARCYTFCVHSRKLCYTCWICSDTQTDPGLLLTNKRSTKSDTVDSCYEEQNDDDSSTSSTDNFFCHPDSEDEEEQQQKEEAEIVNTKYTLKTGTIITFIPQCIWVNQRPIRRVITVVKEDCDTTQFPLIMH